MKTYPAEQRMETNQQALDRIFGKAPLMVVAKPKPLHQFAKPQGKTFNFRGGQIKTWKGQGIWCAEFRGDICIFGLGATQEKAIQAVKKSLNEAYDWIHRYPASKRQYQYALGLKGDR